MELNKKGQTLVEVSIVFAIASIVIISLVILASSALRQAQESVRRVTASKLANAGIEAVIFYKNIYGFTSTPFPTGSSPVCSKIVSVDPNSPETSLAPASCSGDSVTTLDNLSYNRVIQVSRSGNIYTVAVTVSWNTGGGAIDSINISRIFTNYDY